MLKMIDLFSAGFVYFCVATVFAQLIGITVLGSRGYITHDKLGKINAVIHGLPMENTKTSVEDSEKGTIDSRREASHKRTVASLDLSLREQFINQGLVSIRGLRDEVQEEKRRYLQMRDAFDKRLQKLKSTSEEKGLVQMRKSLEQMKPPQQKRQLEILIENDQQHGMEYTVAIVKTMSKERLKKLFAEFRQEDDEELAEILSRILCGEPEILHIQDTQNRLRQFDSN